MYLVQRVINDLIIFFIILFVGLQIFSQFVNPVTQSTQPDSVFYLYALIAFISSIFIFKSKLPGREVKLSLDNIKLFTTALNTFIICLIFYFLYLDFLQISYEQTYLEWFTAFFSKPWVNLFIASTAIMQVASLYEHHDKTRIVVFSLLAIALLFLDSSDVIWQSSSPIIRSLPQMTFITMIGIAHFSSSAA